MLHQYMTEGIKIKQIWSSNEINMRALYNIAGLHK